MQVATDALTAIAAAKDQVRMAAMQATATVSIEAKQPSAPAMFAMKYIADSTRLSGSEKKTLIRLVAMVDEFAGGDGELMQKVMALAKIIEANRLEGTYRAHTMWQVMEEYWKQREALSGEQAVTVSVTAEIYLAFGVAETAEINAPEAAKTPSNS